MQTTGRMIYLTLFLKGQIIGLHQAKKTAKMLKLLKLGPELSNTFLKPGGIEVNIHLPGSKNLG